MNQDLKNKLFSSVIQSTKPAPVSYKLPRRSVISLGGILSASAGALALIGLLMLALAKVKFLF